MSEIGPRIKVRKTVAEICDGYVLAVDDDGHVSEHRTPADLVRHLRRRDSRVAEAGTSTATVIEWRNAPPGFTVPE